MSTNGSKMSDSTFLPDRDVLFIDIDDTITCFTGAPPQEGDAAFLGHSLLWLMCRQAERQGTDFQVAQRIVRQVHESHRWWDWADFIYALNLNPSSFWQMAYEADREYLRPVCSGLAGYLDRLKHAGFRMFITSNNPSSGSLHKLRLATGIGEIWGSPWFLRCFGPPEIHCMKDEPAFWQRVLAHTGLEAKRITVIGDSQLADVDCPREAGISSAIRLDAAHSGPPIYQDGTWVVGSWEQIVQILEGASTRGGAERLAKVQSFASGQSDVRGGVSRNGRKTFAS